MKSLLFKGVAIFFILLVATSLLSDISGAQFGTVDFFQNHGIFFLIFITFFPRLTLLFSSVASGGVVWWLGLIFCPRILVASLATVAYFHTNPMLVIFSWLLALSGEAFEKWGLGRNRFIFRTYRAPDYATSDARPIKKDEAIEAEFSHKD